MIRDERERDLVAHQARKWCGRLLRGDGPRDTAERAALAHTLDELQHFAVHGYARKVTR